MSRDMLSQEEIDALLKANNVDSEGDATSENDVGKYLTAFEQDALGEIGNISFGSAATALSTLLNQKVDITTPTVTVINRDDLDSEFPQPHVAVHVEYTDGFKGINLLVIRVEDAAIIADLMMGGSGRPESTELSDLHISAVQEAMNQMMGSAATSMSTVFNKLVNISPPGIDVMDLSKDLAGDDNWEEETLVKVAFRVKIGEHGELIDSSIMQLLPVSFAKQMISMLVGSEEESGQDAVAAAVASPEEEAPAAHTAPAPTPPPQPQPAAAPQQPLQPQSAGADPYSQQAQMQGPPPGYPPYPYPPQYQQPPAPQHFGGYGTAGGTSANVKPAEFAPFGSGPVSLPDEHNLNLLLDIPLQVTVELGRTRKLIKEILDLSAGSIIQLDKLAGEPVDILVNNKLIAKGEVVVIDENFGVRVTDIISQWDRVQKLQ
ncbi:flagellar motor switch phosphatase FliY [Brevibacillus humidisoli]|uniref:flagellar motor switch phosphatase FliY n=1 Tax=Brevibacillus humidisoli TaxID=2895522 RepID=UPI001E61B299|nr:flagellar motor switch phosphatase FliY [Brevibacillus humidisoli]UFJ42136.1 flagellar motor switch phosphatase FliY [Brevibacillus humidisoli]